MGYESQNRSMTFLLQALKPDVGSVTTWPVKSLIKKESHLMPTRRMNVDWKPVVWTRKREPMARSAPLWMSATRSLM